MELTGSLPYTATDDYQIVDLPYGGKAFSMTVVLPREGRFLEDLVASLDPATWNAMLAGLSSHPGTVRLPRFRMEWEKTLNETLKAMGMELPFLPGQADFSGMSDDALPLELHIKKVKQKAYVDVNEEGTEAAAVTSVEMGVTSVPSPFTFQADRPFLFVLRERLSGTLLFAGIYLEPPEA
jgi:serpin B